jgi:hypothetical protein
MVCCSGSGFGISIHLNSVLALVHCDLLLAQTPTKSARLHTGGVKLPGNSVQAISCTDNEHAGSATFGLIARLAPSTS